MALICRQFEFNLSRPLVMGIINVTPDSFSDGGQFRQRDAALKQIEQLIAQGADILDIGGESTRPGAEEVSLDEELSRVMPVLEALTDCPIPISIDTYKPELMSQAIQAGVSLVNDVNALQAPGALALVAQSDVAICMMHKQGTPLTMQQKPNYNHIVSEVSTFLQQRIKQAQQLGISLSRIIIDPGFGFGKTQQHNVELLREFSHFSALGVTLLAGISRKSMLGNIVQRPAEQRVAASIAAALIAVQNGAHIVRVHDVAATVDALKVWCAIQELDW